MDRYVATFTNRVDSKGRVSVPAPFRTVLSRDGFAGLFLLPALEGPAWDCGGNALMAEIDRLLASLPPCSADRDQVSLALFGASEILRPDPEGRVPLTDAIRQHAGIGESVTFVGMGSKFQLWAPERLEARLGPARARAKALRSGLPAEAAAR